MNGKPSAFVTPLMISAMRMACSSLSITHGPAIRKRSPAPMRTSPIWKEEIKGFDNRNPTKSFHHRGTEAQRIQFLIVGFLCVSVVNLVFQMLASRYFFRTMKHLYRGTLFHSPPLRAMLIGRRNERAEQRMRLQRLRLELGMKLAPDEMWMVGQFYHLHISSVRRRARDAQPSRYHRLFVFTIEFVAMAVPLADFQLAVDLGGQSVGFDLARPGAQTHGAAKFFDPAQLTQLVN